MLYKTERKDGFAGLQSETIHLDNLKLPQGIYFVKVITDRMLGIQKLVIK
jgi:uncharacterized protein YlaN (UPF0358 family)